MLKNKFFIPLFTCAMVITLKALDENFNTKLNHAEQTAKEIVFNLKNKNDLVSLQDLKKLTASLISELQTLPNYLEKKGDKLFVQVGDPTTTGIILRKKEFSQKAFFNDINNLNRLHKQIRNKNQFFKIIKPINKIFAYFNIDINPNY